MVALALVSATAGSTVTKVPPPLTAVMVVPPTMSPAEPSSLEATESPTAAPGFR